MTNYVTSILVEQYDYIIVSGVGQCELREVTGNTHNGLTLKCNLCYNQAKAYILWRICLGVLIPAMPIHVKRHQAVS